MLPGWQRWMKLDRRCFDTPDVTRLAAAAILEVQTPQMGGAVSIKPYATACPVTYRLLWHAPNVAQRRAHEGACHLEQEARLRTSNRAAPRPPEAKPTPPPRGCTSVNVERVRHTSSKLQIDPLVRPSCLNSTRISTTWRIRSLHNYATACPSVRLVAILLHPTLGEVQVF